MLCDYCGAQFHSDEAFTEHEKNEARAGLSLPPPQDIFLQYFRLANRTAERLSTEDRKAQFVYIKNDG